MSLTLETVNDLGSLDDICSLLERISSIGDAVAIKDLRNYCLSISISFAHSFEGIVELLSFTNIVKVEGKRITITELGLSCLKSISETEVFKLELIETLIEALRNNNILSQFISLDKIKYDIPSKSISLASSSIPLKYFPLRNFLISVGFFKHSELSPNILLVDHTFTELFEKLINKLREEYIILSPYRLFTYQQLQDILAIKEEYGIQAEEFALKYEKEILAPHHNVNDVKIISNVDVGAGYDIISFISETSFFIDKFIEVKSFSKTPTFYWSKNEVEASRKLEDHYFIYLVDRSQFRNPNYVPTIIKNPYETIFQSKEWDKNPINWFVSKL